jgi:hypothetical protein
MSEIYAAGGTELLMVILFYLFGLTVHAHQIPERVYPGKFDIWVSSAFFGFLGLLNSTVKYCSS